MKESFLVFRQVENLDRKTKVFVVENKQHEVLGRIGWRSSWRRYVFMPEVLSGVLFDANCLQDIAEFLTDLMLERKK